MTPTARLSSSIRQEPLPAGVGVLRLEARQLPLKSQHHQRDVLRHPLSLQRIDRADDGHMRRQVRRRQQLVDAGPGARDEFEPREPRRDPRRELEGEQRLDVAGRRGAGIRVDSLLGGEHRQRGALVLDERRGGEDENGHGEASATAVAANGRREPPLLYTLDTLFAAP